MLDRKSLIEAIVEKMIEEGVIAPPSAHKNWGLIPMKKPRGVLQDKGEKVVCPGRAFK